VTAPRFLASFDIEDWFHSANATPYLGTDDWDALPGTVERNTNELLDILGELGAKSTFFVLGWVARRYPGLVRRMVDEGHEVASHTDLHKHLLTLSRAEITADLARARQSLEQVTGAPVRGLRAPNFSISEDVLDALAEAGYWYDSSFFAFRAHDRYGQLETPIDPDRPVVEARPGLLELPMSRLPVGGAPLPWAGGAYFRLIPYAAYRAGVRQRMQRRSWFMFYFHPWELDADEVPPAGMPLARRARSYVGRGRMRRDLRRLLAEFGSHRIDETLASMGFAPPA
jgi:polysaccharide deacetylase family protein (PEP-CTERM system associated)